MNLKQLQKLGALTPNKLYKRTVNLKVPVLKPKEEWADPEVEEFTGDVRDETIDVHIRKQTSADTLEIMRSSDRSQAFVVIYRAICNPDGTPLFESLEQAESLQLWIALPLLEAISEVAGSGPKASAPKTSSGAN